MFPFNFEWIWDMSHSVFMGGLWYALTILGLGMTWCVIKAILDTTKGGGGHDHSHH
ncbi:MAG: hypothetical protein WA151_13655 [Desulfatirhabdiaceae bacterium]